MTVPMAAFVFSWVRRIEGTEMAKARDLSGQRFGRLVAEYDTGERTKHRSVIWHCRCDCGNEIDSPASALVSGNTSSCGCLRNGCVGGGIGGGKPIDVTGQRFGKLTAIKRIGSDRYRYSLWEFQCDCGNKCVKQLRSVKRGEVTSCGCNFKPYDHNNERLYRMYHGMKARCYNKNNSGYKWYGALGVKVCDEWLNDFNVFAEWALANGYDKTAPRGRFTLDRINPYGNYEPSNCRWVSIEEQQRNKRHAS